MGEPGQYLVGLLVGAVTVWILVGIPRWWRRQKRRRDERARRFAEARLAERQYIERLRRSAATEYSARWKNGRP